MFTSISSASGMYYPVPVTGMVSLTPFGGKLCIKPTYGETGEISVPGNRNWNKEPFPEPKEGVVLVVENEYQVPKGRNTADVVVVNGGWCGYYHCHVYRRGYTFSTTYRGTRNGLMVSVCGDSGWFEVPITRAFQIERWPENRFCTPPTGSNGDHSIKRDQWLNITRHAYRMFKKNPWKEYKQFWLSSIGQ